MSSKQKVPWAINEWANMCLVVKEAIVAYSVGLGAQVMQSQQNHVHPDRNIGYYYHKVWDLIQCFTSLQRPKMYSPREFVALKDFFIGRRAVFTGEIEEYIAGEVAGSAGPPQTR